VEANIIHRKNISKKIEPFSPPRVTDRESTFHSSFQKDFCMSPRPTRLALTLRHVLFGASLSLSSLPLAFAAEVSSKPYHIAPSELETALNQFGRQAGVLISYGSAVTSGLKSQGLQGEFTTEQGLAALLKGTGLQARADGNNGFSLEPVSTAKDSATPVNAPVELGASTVVGDWLGKA